jgi:hypothetical protein
MILGDLTAGLVVRDTSNMPRYVYAVRFGPYLKIGISENPKRRIMQFGFPSTQQAQPSDVRNYPAEPIFAVAASAKVERILHAIFAPYRITGEWFSADAMTWIEPLLASEQDGLRYHFRVDPAPKESPCECYYECEDCSLHNSWHSHEDAPCPHHANVPLAA